MVSAAPQLPREIQLEVTGACNLACTMCLVSYRPKIGKRQGALEYEQFRRIVDELPELERLTLQGLGEPLLAPRLVEMVAYAAARGIAVGFNTNAQLLTAERSRQLVEAGVAWLHVSVDGATAATYERIRSGAHFALLERHVPALTAAANRRAGGRPAICLVFVAMRRNIRELPDVIRLAARWGVPSVRVQNLSNSFDDTDPSGSYAEIRRYATEEALFTARDLGLARAVFDDAQAVAADLGLALRLPRLDAPPAPEARPGRGCDWPFSSAYVTHTGAVQPCCMVMGSERATLGSVRERSFAEVWRGQAYREFRRRLEGDDPPGVCQGCSLYRGVF
jgi:radical SAM protein with 4Fe4S-binding SPASM domain